MKQKNFFLLGIFFLLLIFAAIFFNSIYKSMHSEILQMQIETQKISAEEKILSNFSARNENLDDFTNLSEENFFTSREKIPEDMEQEKFTEEIYSAAEKNSVDVTSLQTDEPVTLDADKNLSGKFFRQSVKIQLEADYVSLLNFLREIEDGERFSTLANISVEAEEEILICEVEFFIFSAKLND